MFKLFCHKPLLLSNDPISVLSLKDLRFKIHLGCSDKERKTLQTVRVDLSIRFPKPPVGCQSDGLRDTICYDDLSHALKMLCKKHSFHLIEHLCFLLYDKVKEKTPSGAGVCVKVTKLSPPIRFLRGGASFSYGDFYHD